MKLYQKNIYYNEKSDEEIVKLIQNKNKDLFVYIIDRYEEKLLRYARRLLPGYNNIEDLVQEVFIKTYVNIKGFDTSKKFSSWIYRIAHNNFVNAIIKREKDYFLFFNPDTILSIPSKNKIIENIEKKEKKEELELKLKNIKTKYREILILYYFEEKSYKEISDILKIPISTVGVRIRRALIQLKKLY